MFQYNLEHFGDGHEIVEFMFEEWKNPGLKQVVIPLGNLWTGFVVVKIASVVSGVVVVKVGKLLSSCSRISDGSSFALFKNFDRFQTQVRQKKKI